MPRLDYAQAFAVGVARELERLPEPEAAIYLGYAPFWYEVSKIVIGTTRGEIDVGHATAGRPPRVLVDLFLGLRRDSRGRFL